MGVKILDATNYLSAVSQTTGIFSGGAESNYPFTIAAWIYDPAGADATYAWPDNIGIAASIGEDATGEHTIGVGHSHVGGVDKEYGIAFRFDGSSASGQTTTLTTTKWYLVVMVVNSATSRTTYLRDEGGAVTSSDASDSTAVNSTGLDSMRIGPSQFRTYAGYVAEVAIWSSALSSTDIDDLASYYASGVQAGTLAHYWPLNGDFNDAAGSINLTETGTVASAGAHPSLSAAPGGGPTPPFVSVTVSG